MTKKKDPLLEELMWDISRAEGSEDGCLSANFSGSIRDIAAGENVYISTDDEIRIFNLGVTTGIRAILNQLCEQGYTLRDNANQLVRLQQIPDDKGILKKIPFGESHKRWLKDHPPRLTVVKK